MAYLGESSGQIFEKKIEQFAHPVKIELNKKLFPKKRTIQAFNIDA